MAIRSGAERFGTANADFGFAGGSLLRPPGKTEGLNFAFLKDPDGNQIEMVMTQR